MVDVIEREYQRSVSVYFDTEDAALMYAANISAAWTQEGYSVAYTTPQGNGGYYANVEGVRLESRIR